MINSSFHRCIHASIIPELLDLPHAEGCNNLSSTERYNVPCCMSLAELHPWDLSPEVAILVQTELRPRLILKWDGRSVSTVGGVAVRLKEEQARAAIVVLSFPDLTLIEASTAEAQLIFPYTSGLLAFREGPLILAAWEVLSLKPDLLLFNGQGIAHPRGLGIASHMGLWLECPTIGVAKTRLYGRHSEPGPDRGDLSTLYDEHDHEQAIGVVLRTGKNVKPLFVSPGHLIDITRSAAFVMECVKQYRLPESIRWAHRIAGGEKLPYR
jgi:deoxyribonuclease V